MYSGEHHGGVSGVKSWGDVALIERGLLFIDNYEAKGLERQKKAAACAKQYVRLTAADTVGNDSPAGCGLLRMVYKECLIEFLPESGFQFFCKGSFRYHKEDTVPSCKAI